jgi:hypothetical protein
VTSKPKSAPKQKSTSTILRTSNLSSNISAGVASCNAVHNSVRLLGVISSPYITIVICLASKRVFKIASSAELRISLKHSSQVIVGSGGIGVVSLMTMTLFLLSLLLIQLVHLLPSKAMVRIK